MHEVAAAPSWTPRARLRAATLTLGPRLDDERHHAEGGPLGDHGDELGARLHCPLLIAPEDRVSSGTFERSEAPAPWSGASPMPRKRGTSPLPQRLELGREIGVLGVLLEPAPQLVDQ